MTFSPGQIFLICADMFVPHVTEYL